MFCSNGRILCSCISSRLFVAKLRAQSLGLLQWLSPRHGTYNCRLEGLIGWFSGCWTFHPVPIWCKEAWTWIGSSKFCINFFHNSDWGDWIVSLSDKTIESQSSSNHTSHSAVCRNLTGTAAGHSTINLFWFLFPEVWKWLCGLFFCL